MELVDKLTNDQDFWICSSGSMPAQLRQSRHIHLEGEVGKILSRDDTATSLMSDFECKHIHIATALMTSMIPVLSIAIGGSSFAAIFNMGVAAGAGGAVLRDGFRRLLCGQKMAILRSWSFDDDKLLHEDQEFISTKSILNCPVFNSKIVHVPHVNSWWDALKMSLGNFGENVILQSMGKSLMGTAEAISYRYNTGNTSSQIIKAFINTASAGNLYFGASTPIQAESFLGILDRPLKQDISESHINIGELGCLKRITSGTPQPMDLGLLLYFKTYNFNKD